MPQAMPAGLSAFNEIIDDLNALVKSEACEFEFRRTLKELEARAEDLKLVSFAYGCSALASVATARGDVAAMHKFHKISLQHGPADVALLFNYAISLGKVGLKEEAFRYDLEAVQADPLNKDILNHITLIAFDLGRESEYREFSKRFEELTGTQHMTWPLFLAEMDEISEVTSACAAATARTMTSLDA